jgi:hypothetical protein
LFDFYLTEKEAKTKECRVAPPFEDEDLGTVFHRCCASECALWRWKNFQCDAEYFVAVKKAAASVHDNTPSKSIGVTLVNKDRTKWGLPDKPTTGFCGAAGNPKGS